MRILFVIGPLRKGGAERVVCNLSNELSKDNEVIIATTIDNKSDYHIDEKVKIICLDDDSMADGFISKNIKRIKKLRNIIIYNNIDVAISFLPEPSYRLMIAKTKKVKTIISVRNDPNIEYNSILKKIITKILYNKADGFIFQTKDAKSFFNRRIQNKSTIIPNPINESFICKPYNGERNKTIVTVGRLVSQKNQQLLINAFYEIYQKHKDYKLKIYGDGELKNDLEKLIDELKMNDNILLMGNANNIKEEIYKDGIFVLTSNYEGMPNSLMEALALGIPSISTNCPCGGPKSLIEDKKSGLLVEVNNIKELVSSINYLIENPKIANKYGQTANVDICRRLNPIIINEEWKKYIYYVLNR